MLLLIRASQVVNAAVVVDPTTKRVISSASDQVRGCTIPKCYANIETNCVNPSEPTKFAKLLDIGKHQKKLASHSPCDSEHFVSCLHPLRWTEQQQLIGSGSWHPLQHAAMVAIESSAARDRLLFPSDGPCPVEFAQEDHNLSLGTDLPSKRQKTQLSSVSFLSSVILVHELSRRVEQFYYNFFFFLQQRNKLQCQII